MEFQWLDKTGHRRETETKRNRQTDKGGHRPRPEVTGREGL